MIKADIIGRAIADFNPNIVGINEAALSNADIPKGELKLLSSELGKEWHDRPTTAIAFFIALNSINYMFWSLQSVAGRKALVRYQYDDKIGAAGMRAAFNRMWGETPYLLPLRTKIEALGGFIPTEFVREHFGDIPDALGRAQVLDDIFKGNELEDAAHRLYGKILTERKLTVADAFMLHDAFPRAYNDPYAKRAQLALIFVAAFFSEMGTAVDISDLTVAADYQLPRMLRGMGILSYSPDLAAKVDNLVLLNADSPEELAIRAATILACQRMAAQHGVSDAHVDNYLWTNRSKAGSAPFHLTFTEAY